MSTTCRDCIELLRGYLEGELPGDQRSALEAHLNACPPCVDFLNGYVATPKICKKALQKSMPDAVAASLHEFLRKHMGEQSS